MAKHHYVHRTRTDTFMSVSAGLPVTGVVDIGSRNQSDTYVRSVWSPRFVTRIDPSTSPPIDEWWNGARVSFTLRFSSTGSSSPGATEDDATMVGIIDLYPTVVRDSPTNALSYVIFAPLDGPAKFVTSRKGDGVNFPRVISAFWPQDHNAVFQNPGGLYSVVHSWSSHNVVIWASDSP
jgi:hypothetical protein